MSGDVVIILMSDGMNDEENDGVSDELNDGENNRVNSGACDGMESVHDST